MDTDLQQTRKDKPRQNYKSLPAATNSNSFPLSYNLWLITVTKIFLIFVISLLLFFVLPERIVYLFIISSLVIWILLQNVQVSKLLNLIKNPDDEKNISTFGSYDLLEAGVLRLIRTKNQQQDLLNKTIAAFKRSTEAMSDGVVVLNSHDQIVVATPRAERYLKIKSELDRGKNIINLVRNPEFADYLQKKNSSKSVVLENLPIENRVIELQVLPYDEHERLLVCRDITKLKRLESSRKDFVANVSHELKTPLTIVKGYIETMIEIPLKEIDKKNMLNEISNQTFRMENLVSDLLTLSRLDSEEINAAYLKVDLEDIFRKLAENSHQTNKEKQEISIDIEKRFSLLGNSEDILSAFWNLTNNAIIYTPPNSKIKITWKINPKLEGIFEISDNGPGIEGHHLPFLTERFYRVDKSRSQKSGGTGLGLSIVKNIVLKHESKLEIESKTGKGSNFKIIFPSHRIKKIEKII